ncbi:YceD family protein [Nitriliruptor alkaliphilus]|uniref:YceD family protein n=1 Tax=Nitriliruptor alkaliphilus TaxID=427918 RepID=UPI000698D7E8|nr:DUF177 domain-containing protein [Nitriliruptor alkaliphilus]
MRVPVTDLVGHPGETRPFAAAASRDAFGQDPWGPADEAIVDPIRLDLHLDSVVEGILVRGRIDVELVLPCARCLEPQGTDRTLEVAELFLDPTKREDDTDEDPGYELVDDRTAIDLSTLVRDAVVIDLPTRILCREDCQGLCPVCGTDRNTRDCGHGEESEPDARWAKLAELDLPRDQT